MSIAIATGYIIHINSFSLNSITHITIRFVEDFCYFERFKSCSAAVINDCIYITVDGYMAWLPDHHSPSDYDYGMTRPRLILLLADG